MDISNFIIRGKENGQAHFDEGALRLSANSKTDWFHNPVDNTRQNNVISAVSEVNEKVFSLSAKVSVSFASAFDAGAIFLEVTEDYWAKLAFEYSALNQPTIVSVITRESSDDCDGPHGGASYIWLRLYTDGKACAFHFSNDGKFWHFLRWFSIPHIELRPIKIGFGVQSPTGQGCTAHFSDITVNYGIIENLRNGS